MKAFFNSLNPQATYLPTNNENECESYKLVPYRRYRTKEITTSY